MPLQQIPDHAGAYQSRLGPEWRWKLAQPETPRVDRLLPPPRDRHLRDACRYRELCARDPNGWERARVLYPLVAAAEALQEDPARTALLRIAVVGDMPPVEIAQYFGLEGELLAMWETLFFDVRAMLASPGWIHAWVVKPELAAGEADGATRLTMAATGGAVAARAILRADWNLPLDEAQRLEKRRLLLDLKMTAVLAQPIDSEQAKMQFLRLWIHLHIAEQRLDLAREKLRQRCAEAIDRRQLAEMRLEYRRECDEVRAADKRRRAERRAVKKAADQQARLLAAEFWRRRALAQRREAAARAASSPLAQLRWGTAADGGKLTADKVAVSATPAPVDLRDAVFRRAEVPSGAA